jgi:NADH-quinone oxidoreductase subunit C
LSSANTDASADAAADVALAAASALVSELEAALGDAVVQSEVRHDDAWIRLSRGSWLAAARTLRDDLGFDYFCFLSGIDWMPSAPNAEDAEAATVEPESDDDGESAAPAEEEPATPPPAEAAQGDGWETGVAGGDTRFQMLARLYSTSRKQGITLKADLDDDDPRIESWVSVYRGADWHERETWEMYGFQFDGHPGLRHIYLPSEFEGFPLRKDYPLLAREVKPWPGLVDVEPMPEDAEAAGDAAAAATEPSDGPSESGEAG